MAGAKEYKIFEVALARKQTLSPSMMRCVFSGESVREMTTGAPDQRIKLLFPAIDGTPSQLPDVANWYTELLALPKRQRPIARTYTLRRLNAAAGELEVEFVIHGTEGPASSWAMSAEPGDRLQVVAPCAASESSQSGYEWRPTEQTRRALLIADETAFPAVKGILEQLAGLASPPQVQAFIELPLRADCQDFSHFTFADIHWLPREGSGANHGERLLDAVRDELLLPQAQSEPPVVELSDVPEDELLWERAESQHGQFFGWVAAESSVVKALRRYLVGERGVARESMAFMAYWCQGPRRER
ncbi:siderophore-interacting protein [Lonsdalea britannica]|uniref:siderophore-interacting protein n=1 Tax=Lonsdalea britannica TaxID=1082704 RepID=UPI0026ED0341|nr:siderophore-interacting protein [Lonsdalea britannica]